MFQAIQNDILHFVNKYLGQGLLFALLCLSGLLIGICVYRKMYGLPRFSFQGKIIYKGILLYAFFFYIYMVWGITFFSREPSKTATVDLKLFHTFANHPVAKLFIYENILMFVPLGFFTYLLFEKCRKIYVAVLLGFLCSVFIEITQYITRLGKLQVDDIFNNVVGMLLGYVMGWIVYTAWYILSGRK